MHFSKLIQENKVAPFHDVRLIYRNKQTRKVELELFELDLKNIKNVPTLIYYGNLDTYSPKEKANEIFDILKRRDDVKLWKVKNAHHLGLMGIENIYQAYVKKMIDWMNKYD